MLGGFNGGGAESLNRQPLKVISDGTNKSTKYFFPSFLTSPLQSGFVSKHTMVDLLRAVEWSVRGLLWLHSEGPRSQQERTVCTSRVVSWGSVIQFRTSSPIILLVWDKYYVSHPFGLSNSISPVSGKLAFFARRPP